MKSLSWVPDVQSKFLFLKQASIVWGMSLFFFWLGPKLDKVLR